MDLSRYEKKKDKYLSSWKEFPLSDCGRTRSCSCVLCPTTGTLEPNGSGQSPTGRVPGHPWLLGTEGSRSLVVFLLGEVFLCNKRKAPVGWRTKVIFTDIVINDTVPVTVKIGPLTL